MIFCGNIIDFLFIQTHKKVLNDFCFCLIKPSTRPLENSAEYNWIIKPTTRTNPEFHPPPPQKKTHSTHHYEEYMKNGTGYSENIAQFKGQISLASVYAMKCTLLMYLFCT